VSISKIGFSVTGKANAMPVLVKKGQVRPSPASGLPLKDVTLVV
jgi:hypothetical protein